MLRSFCRPMAKAAAMPGFKVKVSSQALTQFSFVRFNQTNAADSEKVEKDEQPESAQNEDAVVAKLKIEIKELKDQVLRSYAEEENVRRIAKRDVANARDYANSSFAKALLDVADNLERALGAVPPEKKKSEDPILNGLVEGIDMTEKNLQKVFLQFGILKYGTPGDKFDPDLHDALFQVPDTTRPPGTVSQVLKTGYKLKDRVIRAAQVGTVAER